jgi:hypothetical protein
LVGGMINRALQITDTPVKAIAMDTNYSGDAFYAAMSDKRKIPAGARAKLSSLCLLGGMAVALEATSYNGLFMYDERDRHPMALIQRSIIEDSEADQAVKDVIKIVLEKRNAEDLTPDEVVRLKQVAVEVCESICSDLNLLIEFDDMYKLGLVEWLQAKTKTDRRRQASQSVRSTRY